MEFNRCSVYGSVCIKMIFFFLPDTFQLFIIMVAVLWLMQSVTGLSPWGPRFEPRPACMGFVVGKVAHSGRFYAVYFNCPLSHSYHQYSILIH